MFFSEAIFMTIYTLDTDCIGARHRGAQNLAGKPRHKGCECCKREETGPLFVFLWGLLLAGPNVFNWNPESFRSKLWKGFKTHSALLLHCTSTLLCFALSKNFVVKLLCVWRRCHMRQLQQVLANQLSVRHPGGTLSGLTAMVTHCLPPVSPTSLPGSLH